MKYLKLFESSFIEISINEWNIIELCEFSKNENIKICNIFI